MRRKRLLAISLLLACHPAPTPSRATAAPTVVLASASASSVPPTGDGALVIENDGTIDIKLYAAYIVDERGERGTLALWPHPSDCPDHQPKEHLVPRGGTLALPAPTRGYESTTCTPIPLPSGRYVLRIDPGYAEDFYASAELELPLVAPVRLHLANHGEDPPSCTAAMAQRAARLAFARVKELPGAPTDLLVGCEAEAAVCGTLPLPDLPPPKVCTVTLHERLLRIARPPGDDAPREVIAWTDRAVVYARRPETSRTSASRLDFGGHEIVVEGITEHHRHEHGGDAAAIAHMTLRVHNPLKTDLKYRVDGVEWLTDYSCALPNEIAKKPAVKTATPAVLPPGQSEVAITFAPMEAYQAHCDRFASRARLRIEGHAIAVTVEHEVTRYDRRR